MAGRYERRTWVSHLGESLEIEVFVPDPIAQADWALSLPTTQALAIASEKLGALRTRTDLEPLAQMLLRQEGIASSRIEGLFLSTRRLYEILHAPNAVDDRTAGLVLANIEILQSIMAICDRDLRSEDIRTWHRNLMASTRNPRLRPGAWRLEQNWIGSSGWSPRNAAFIPPHPERVPGLMEDLVRFCHRGDLPSLAQAAIAHAQFETVHPFVDGNGRVGRALIYRVLAGRGSIVEVAPPISSVFAADPTGYIEGLTSYRDGRVDTWVAQFAEAVVAAVRHAVRLGDDLAALRERWTHTLGPVRSDAVILRIVNDLTGQPIIDTPAAAERYHVSLQAARSALVRLSDLGIVREQPLRKARRGRPARVFAATEVFELLDRRM